MQTHNWARGIQQKYSNSEQQRNQWRTDVTCFCSCHSFQDKTPAWASSQMEELEHRTLPASCAYKPWQTCSNTSWKSQSRLIPEKHSPLSVTAEPSRRLCCALQFPLRLGTGFLLTLAHPPNMFILVKEERAGLTQEKRDWKWWPTCMTLCQPRAQYES